MCFKVYFYLFKLLRRCILQLSKPSVEGPLGTPPYEKPSIAKGVTNFVLFKFNHLSPKEWQMMWVSNLNRILFTCSTSVRYDLAKMFLHCLNHWKLETPTARKQQMSSEDVSAYKVQPGCWNSLLEIWSSLELLLQVNYTRWLCYCHVPAFCDSLPHYDTTLIFGRSLLKSVFQVKLFALIV